MEDHGSDHPLLQSSPAGGTANATTLAYAWGFQQHPSTPFDEYRIADTGGGDQDQQLDMTTAAELRRALVRALAELHASRAAHQAELRRMESEAARLAALVSSAAAERDELRRHCHSLLLLLHHQSQAQTPAVQPPPPHTPSLHAASVLSAAGGGGCTTAGAAAVIMNSEMNAPDAAACADESELEMALARWLPEKGRLVEAVVSAGPLLQTLLLAGPLPRWRHPPPPPPADIPPFNPGRRHNSPLKADGASNSFSSGSAGSSSPESNCSGGPPPPPVAHPLPSFHMSPSFCM